jgi:hypothetical protein
MSEDVKADLVSDTEAAKIIHQKETTLATWRSAGRGPAYYKVGRQVLYSVSDLEAWLASRRREPAAQHASAHLVAEAGGTTK